MQLVGLMSSPIVHDAHWLIRSLFLNNLCSFKCLVDPWRKLCCQRLLKKLVPTTESSAFVMEGLFEIVGRLLSLWENEPARLDLVLVNFLIKRIVNLFCASVRQWRM